MGSTKTAAGAMSHITFGENTAAVELYKKQLEGLTLTQQKLAMTTAGLTAEQQKFILSEIRGATVVGNATTADVIKLTTDERKIMKKVGVYSATLRERDGTIALTQAMVDQIKVEAAKIGLDEK